jgi:hypothetical protein
MSEICLIISSYIYPFSDFVKIQNSLERENLHILALEKWINESDFKDIIICDNSNYVYSDKFVELSRLKGKRLEILHFSADKGKGFEFGKGFGEGELMNYIFMNSKLLTYNRAFFKVTGKLFIKNYLAIKKEINSDFVFSAPLILACSTPNHTLVYTYFYYARVDSFKKYLLKSYLGVRDRQGIYLEHIYYTFLKKAQVDNKNVSLKFMSHQPIVQGVSGSTGKNYENSSDYILTIKQIVEYILIELYLFKNL